jgi:hypothetical protein
VKVLFAREQRGEKAAQQCDVVVVIVEVLEVGE